MATSSFELSGINIVTHPHSPEGYINLLKDVFRLRRSVPIKGAQHIMIGELKSLSRNDEQAGLFGRIYRFVKIDKDLPWFNIEKHDVATEDDLMALNIPENLRPNLETFDFVLRAKFHTLYLESKYFDSAAKRYKTLSVIYVAKMLSLLFSIPEVAKKYGEIQVTVLPAKGQLEKILGMKVLKSLEIKVRKPNADEFGAVRRRVFARLEQNHARELVLRLRAEAGESIVLDPEMEDAARVAATDGLVRGKGVGNNGRSLDESTQAKPWKDLFEFDPDVESRQDALIEATEGKPGYA